MLDGWDVGWMGCWRDGMLKGWDVGGMGCWMDGMLEGWDVGGMGCWRGTTLTFSMVLKICSMHWGMMPGASSKPIMV